MKLLAHLLSLVRLHGASDVAHDDNLRAGKDVADRPAQPGHWNGLLL